jgi:hypothetical protein
MMVTTRTKRSSKALAVAGVTIAAGLALCAFWPDLPLAQTAHSSVILDPNFRTPAPPNDAFPQNAEHVFISSAIMTTLALIMVVVALFEGKRYKSTVPIALVMAGALCVFPECVDNYLGGCFWSQSHDPNKIFYFLMGREIDYYVITMWWPFGAILGYVIYATLIRNARTATLWLALAVSGLADIIIEEVLLNYDGVYTYYGHQPLVLLTRFPWWWLFANVSSLFLSVAITYRYREWLNGWRSLLILLLMPLCYIGGFAFTSMPSMFVINGDFSPLVTQVGGLLTVVLSLGMTAGVMVIVLGRNPLPLLAPSRAEGSHGTLARSVAPHS